MEGRRCLRCDRRLVEALFHRARVKLTDDPEVLVQAVTDEDTAEVHQDP